MGKQRAGSYINIVGQLIIGLPCALLLAFKFGFGVEGLVTGERPERPAACRHSLLRSAQSVLPVADQF